MKTSSWIKRAAQKAAKLTASAVFIILGTSLVHSQTTNDFNSIVVTNMLTVEGNSDTYGSIGFGTTTAGSIAAQQMSYTDGTSTMVWIAAKTNSVFLWQENNVGTPKSKLQLDGTNGFTLFSTNGSIGIFLSPNPGGGITLSGSSSGITFSDGTVMSSAGSGVVSLGANGILSVNASSVAIGTGSTASATNSTAFGASNSATGADSTAIGNHTMAASDSSVALGQYNVGFSTNAGTNAWISTDPVFEIGNGVSGARSNAVTIFKSGEVRTAGLMQSKVGVRIPQAGDLNMGAYTNGNSPSTLNPATGLLYPGGN